jgi:hypothetical protein
MLKKLSLGLLVALALVGYSINKSPSEKEIRSKVVKLTGNGYSCSGTQINAPSGNNYIITAGHCADLAEHGSVYVQLDNQRPIPRRVIEVSRTTDLMLLEGVPELDGLSVSFNPPSETDTITSYTHGAGYKTYKSTGEYIETRKVYVLDHIIQSKEDLNTCTDPKFQVVPMDLGFFQIQACVLFIDSYISSLWSVGGSSGGLVVNQSGQMIGVVYGGDDHFSMIVPLSEIHKFLSSY